MLVFLWILVAAPGVFYPSVCYTYRRRLSYKRIEITSILKHGKAFAAYLKAFGTATTPDQTVDKLFELYYAGRAYVLPVAINVALTSAAFAVILVRFGWSFGFQVAEQQIAALPLESAAAIAGAFVWGAYDILRRYETIDLSAVSLHYVWLRMLTAPILAPLAVAALADGLKPMVGFAIGAFPLSALLDFVKRQAKDKLNLSGSVEPTEAPTLNKLQGVTENMLSRLRDEGYESAEHLANADPVRLLLRTNLDWKTILDLIDQAILFDYVGPKTESLRSLGIRGSIELGVVQMLLTSEDPVNVEEGKALIALISRNLGQEEVGVRNLVKNAFEDVQVNLLWDLWGGEELKTEELKTEKLKMEELKTEELKMEELKTDDKPSNLGAPEKVVSPGSIDTLPISRHPNQPPAG